MLWLTRIVTTGLELALRPSGYGLLQSYRNPKNKDFVQRPHHNHCLVTTTDYYKPPIHIHTLGIASDPTGPYNIITVHNTIRPVCVCSILLPYIASDFELVKFIVHIITFHGKVGGVPSSHVRCLYRGIHFKLLSIILDC